MSMGVVHQNFPPKKRNAGEEAHSRGDHSQLLACMLPCLTGLGCSPSRPSVHITDLNLGLGPNSKSNAASPQTDSWLSHYG